MKPHQDPSVSKKSRSRSKAIIHPFPSDPEALVREPQVRQFFPVSKTAWFEGVKKGIYPKPIKHGRSVFWRAGDIRQLVTDLSKGEI